jgi:hypothetical protein
MNYKFYIIYLFTLSIYLHGCSCEPEAAPPQINQFPSPMTDSIRVHKRIENKKIPGVSFSLKDVLPKPVSLYVADQDHKFQPIDLLIHFHGLSYVPQHAVYHANHPFILAVVNLGSGSFVYENAFREELTFPKFIEAITKSVSQKKSVPIKISKIYLSSFSAGYGAIRAILKNHLLTVDGIILLDGLHTDYIPARRVLSRGGKLNEEKLRDFLHFARLAMDGKKKLLIAHSEIFPGTYSSTTETADYLLNSLDIPRNPVLKWGPMGMQLLSETNVKGLRILGFAGNSAPDHIDHFHALPEFLKMIL